ncbi:MAG: hypothetical protein HN778_01955 [Prolixibacteraceae bacterium]|jgi:hypothetical protein|nr:hypothetical protein [Prolixibacteraceae bacterium]MBT6764583.1 hypothetical protein [Prolixibacteraceae bacterium]MBT7000789.1 hypothetical protein [Prolixibacteraceae bacterium]MBT7393574.1 hypothetical protein [Prolixibacteraceae bacterium]
MYKNYFSLIVIATLVLSCATGKKALQKGDYFSAVTKAVERLKSDPDNKKAVQVLSEGYPLAIKWSQEELDLALTSNGLFKWGVAVEMMQQVNHLSDLIRTTPAARKIIPNPKSYSSELNMALEKAAEERYNAGLVELDQNTRETARFAFDHFFIANELIPGFKDVIQKMEISKEIATLKVIVEAVTVNTRKYKLSSEFFYNQVFEFLNNRYPKEGFVNFLSPQQAETNKIERPDYIVRMEFFDFSVGNLTRNEKEEEVKKTVEINIQDTTKVEYKIYSAKLKTYTDKVVSGGQLNFKIVDSNSNDLLRDNLIPGSFTWVNDYAIFAGDIEALNEKQVQITKRKVVPLPPEQDLFIEFTKPIYNQLTGELNSFFRRYR